MQIGTLKIGSGKIGASEIAPLEIDAGEIAAGTLFCRACDKIVALVGLNPGKGSGQ